MNRNVLIIGGSFAVAAGFGALRLYSDHLYNEGSYEVKPTDQAAAEQAFAQTFVGGPAKDAILAYPHTDVLEYWVFGKHFRIFHDPQDVTLPTKAVLDGWAHYIKEENSKLLFSHGLGDVAEIHQYVGKYGPNIMTQTGGLHRIQLPGMPISVPLLSVVNYDQQIWKPGERQVPVDRFAVEFYQSLYTKQGLNNGDDILYQEELANEFGIAVGSIAAGLSYDEYRAIATVEGYVLAGKVELSPIPEINYNALKAITLDLPPESRSAPILAFAESIIGASSRWYLESLPKEVTSSLPDLFNAYRIFRRTGQTL